MVQSGVNPVANSMMGRPGTQQQTPGQGPMGNPPSECFSEDFCLPRKYDIYSNFN